MTGRCEPLLVGDPVRRRGRRVCLVDFIWLAFVGKQLLDDRLGPLLAARPNVAAAVVFYAIFVAGLGTS